METYYSISKLCEMGLESLPSSSRGIQQKANRERWPFIEVAGRGGKGGKRREYRPPEAVLAEIREREAGRLLAGTAVPEAVPALPVAAKAAGGTAAQRACEGARLGILKAVEDLMAELDIGKEDAMTMVLVQARQPAFGHLAKMFELARDKRGAAGTLPSKRTIHRWFDRRDANRLMPAVREADMGVPVWLPLFLGFYRLPQKPTVEMAYRAFAAALPAEMPDLDRVPSIHQVRRALAKTGKVAREDGRMGRRELKNILPHKRREFLHLPPAAVYTADGHTFDAEVLNPLSGLPFRPEVTTVVDIATRRCMGWSVGLAESRFTVLEALCHACRTAVGAVWYVDWGKGFENLMMTDEATGIMGRLGMTMKHSLAYNSQAKGASERSHHIFTRAAKMLASYVGRDMDAEARKALFFWSRREIRLHGKVVGSPIPTWDEFKDFIERTVADYNARPHRSLPKVCDADGKKRHMTPDEMWALKVKEFGEPPKVSDEDAGWLFRPQDVNSIPKLSHSCGLKLSHPMSGVSSGKNHCPSQKYHSNKSGGPVKHPSSFHP